MAALAAGRARRWRRRAAPATCGCSTDPINAPSSALDTGGQIATCPVGTVVWGGGVSFTGGQFALGESINTTAPNGSDDVARPVQQHHRPHHPDRHPRRLRQPAGAATRMQFATADNPPHTQSHAIAICPSNAVLLSGGAFSTSDKASVFMLSDFPVTQRKFRVVMWNGSERRTSGSPPLRSAGTGRPPTRSPSSRLRPWSTATRCWRPGRSARSPTPGDRRRRQGARRRTRTSYRPARSTSPNTQWISDTAGRERGHRHVRPTTRSARGTDTASRSLNAVI